jgi:hypothetical protein
MERYVINGIPRQNERLRKHWQKTVRDVRDFKGNLEARHIKKHDDDDIL